MDEGELDLGRYGYLGVDLLEVMVAARAFCRIAMVM